MMKNAIYYFSGTGNSLRAAQRIAERLGDTEIISMRNNPEEVSGAEYEMIGFVYPVYHWTMPEPVVQFIEKLEINAKAYIFVVVMPSFVTGYACERLEEILYKKNAVISYGAKVNSVANYAIVYPPMPSPKLVVPKTEKKLTKISDEIKAKKFKNIPRAGKMVRRRYSKVMPAYKSLQQYADYPFTISEDCISCGLCTRICPCANIKMKDGKPSFQHHCAQCMACVCHCPKRAIGYKIKEEELAQLSDLFLNVPIVKMMGLPPKRKLYHNPYVKVSDLAKDRIRVE